MRAAIVALAIGLGVAACGGRQPSAAEERALLDERSPYAFFRALTYTLVRTGQFSKALPHARRLPLLRPDDAESHYLLGRVYAGLGLNEAALEVLERSHRLSPRFLPTITLLGVTYDALGRHREAQAWHRRALAFARNSPVLLNNLGFSYYLEGRFAEALATYQHALRYDVGSRRLHNNVAFAYGRLGRFEEAERHFRMANRPGEALNNLGLLRESRGELQAARDYFAAALAADAGLETSRENLTRVDRALAAAGAADAISSATRAPRDPSLQGVDR